ncbi:9686_t:CDS:1 [Diversispora eburnea]|uniref:Large ribosomal subunit protein bL32m n=1 Tax=Diversispora eburnea TaxID=1213867 RepID=A0A9N8ZFI1_9GLOM|nr:9686_t:CDS:1 [Diversispora eburnea]
MTVQLTNALFRQSFLQYNNNISKPILINLPYSNPINTLWKKTLQKVGTLIGLSEAIGSFLLAAPKKKTSHSKKRMRSANKGLKDKTNIVNCPGCGQRKLMHHLCLYCYRDYTLKLKWERRRSSSS